jgi:hypothetical protein
MALERKHPRSHHAAERRGGLRARFDFQTGHGQRVGERVAVERRIDQSAQPVFGELHFTIWSFADALNLS